MQIAHPIGTQPNEVIIFQSRQILFDAVSLPPISNTQLWAHAH
jgi:hypothetical protein